MQKKANAIAQGFAALGWGKRGLILIALGIVIGLGHAPLNWWWASVIGLAAALVLTRSGTSTKSSFWHGWALGLGYFGFSLRWIISPFLVHVERDGWMAPFAVVLMAAGFALFWGLAAVVSERVFKSQTLAFPLCLAAVEALRSFILTGFPWALLGHTLIATPFVDMAAFGGPHVLTMIVVLLATGLFCIALGQWKRGVLGLLSVVLVAGGVSLSRPTAGLTESTVRLIQPNAPQDEKWDIDKRHVFFDRMIGFTGEGDVSDLVVWPESSIPVLLHYADPELEMVTDAARGAPVIVGVNRAQEGLYHNSFILLGRGGQIDDIYDKQHLVPFGEYVPGGDLLHNVGIKGFGSSYGGGFTPGSGKRTIDVPGIGAVRPLICYEGIFAEEIGGSEERPQAMVLITNDAWFGKDAGPFQHLAQAQLRAIEQGIPMVRVANTGVSAMIDARGQVTASIPLNTAGYLDALLPAPLPPTQYSKTGDWPVLVLLALMLSIVGFRRRTA
jgi:apolipoprotein N-acyltransferase